MINKPNNQQGFLLLATIFIIVVLSGLAAIVVNMVSIESKQSDINLQYLRAYYAARSGLAIAHYQLKQAPDKCLDATIKFSASDQGLNGFNVNITCINNQQGFQVQAQAEYGKIGDHDFVRRTVTGPQMLAPSGR